MEKNWTLETSDGHLIYGVTSSPVIRKGQRCRGAIFMVHGLTSSMNDYAFKRAADFFSRKGYAVFRFNLYDGNPKGRRLEDCTLQTHAQDLHTVLKAFAAEYRNVFLIGHSYGGPTVMIANPEGITAVSLWDPSFDLERIHKDFIGAYEEYPGFYVVRWGTSYLIGKGMVAEKDSYGHAACVRLAKAFRAPVQVVLAGNGYFIKEGKGDSYHAYGDKRNRVDVVPGTEHNFHEGNSCDVLLRKVAGWFESFGD